MDSFESVSKQLGSLHPVNQDSYNNVQVDSFESVSKQLGSLHPVNQDSYNNVQVDSFESNPSLICLVVSMDVKRHVYVLTLALSLDSSLAINVHAGHTTDTEVPKSLGGETAQLAKWQPNNTDVSSTELAVSAINHSRDHGHCHSSLC